MIKGLAGGVLAGAVVAVAGLAVLSQLSPPPAPFVPETAPGPVAVAPVSETPAAPPAPMAEVKPETPAKAPVPPPPAVTETAAPAPVAAAELPSSGVAQAEAPVEAPSLAPVPQAPPAPVADAPAAVASVPAIPPVAEPAAPAALPETVPAADASPDAPAVAMAEATSPLPPPAPEAPQVTPPAPVVEAPPAGPGPAVQEDTPEVAALTDPATPEVPAPALASPDGLSLPAPGPLATPPAADPPPMAQAVPAEVPPPEPLPEQVAEETPGLLTRPAPLAPAQGLVDAEGVRVGRLPSIGAGAQSPDQTPTAEVATTEAALPDANAPPLQRFARAFENPSGKPLFSIVLMDTGEPTLDRAALAALPFPVTFALDPTLPGADLAATIYRDGGQEVVILVQSLPQGATASDVAVNMEALAGAMPEAVAVMDGEAGGFQSNRVLAGQVVPVVGGQGRAILSWDRGLNAAAQVARREGVAAATILRRIDAEGESAPIMRRYLDRAAFKAVQDGRVVVAGTTQPETVAVLLEWAVEGRASSVTLAPVSAVVRP